MWSWDHIGEAALTNGRLISMTPPNVSPNSKEGLQNKKPRPLFPTPVFPPPRAVFLRLETRGEGSSWGGF